MKFKFSHKVSQDAGLSPKPAGLDENQTKAPESEDNNSTLASIEQTKSDSSFLLEDSGLEASDVASNPSPGAKPKKARPRPVRPKPEERLAALVSKHPMSWSCKDVGDWLECLAIEKYRKAFTHHAVTGQLLPKLTDSTLKEELGVTSLGHRELMLRSIASLFESWAKDEKDNEQAGYAAAQQGNGSSSWATPKSAAPLQVVTIPGAEIVKSQERRARLAHDLEKATSRAAQRRAAAEQAQRNAELADKEVERLHAALKEAEIESNGGKFGMAVKTGGKNLQSPRKKELSGIEETKFMDRLQADLQAREKKSKTAAGKVKYGNRQAKGTAAAAASGTAEEAGSPADAGSLKSCLELLQSICAEKDPSFTEFLEMPKNDDEEAKTKLSIKLNDLVGRLAGELGIDDKDVEIVKNAQGPNKKAQKLTVAVKKAIFMQRLDQDLSAREQRNKEIKQQVKQERAAAAKAAEEKDLKEAKEVFAELGWPAEAIQAGSTTVDDLLSALLKRARAAQVARAAAKAVDWELHREDGLLALISDQIANNSTLATAAPPPPATGSGESAELSTLSSSPAKTTMPASGPPVLQETVNLLSQCRGDELDHLETLKGTRKILSIFRAIRAQEFLRTTREKLEVKVAKAAEYQASQRPERKVLPKEAAEAFLQRLSEDAARRARNREELQTKAREEEKKKSVPVVIKGKSTSSASPAAKK